MRLGRCKFGILRRKISKGWDVRFKAVGHDIPDVKWRGEEVMCCCRKM